MEYWVLEDKKTKEEWGIGGNELKVNAPCSQTIKSMVEKLEKEVCLKLEKLSFESYGSIFPRKEGFQELLNLISKTKSLRELELNCVKNETGNEQEYLVDLVSCSPHFTSIEIQFRNGFPRETKDKILESVFRNEKIERLLLTFGSSQQDTDLFERLAFMKSLKILKVDFSRTQISQEEAKKLFRAVEESKTITSFSVTNMMVCDFFGLENNNTLEKLSLKFCKLSKADEIKFATFLSKNTSLKSLELLIQIKESLIFNKNHFSGNNSITKLKIAANSCIKQLAEGVSFFVSTNNNLRTLDLHRCGLREDAGMVLEAVRDTNSIKKLVLSGNYLGSEMDSKIAEMISKNESIEEIHLSGNPLSSCVQLFEALKENKRIKVFDISNASLSMDEKNIPALSQVIVHNTSLTRLSLADNKAGKQIVDIYRALSHNSTLKEVDVSKNLVEGEGREALVEMIAQNNSLKTVIANYTGISKRRHAEELLEALEKNSCLTCFPLNLKTTFDKIQKGINYQISLNVMIEQRDRHARVLMLALHRRRDGNVVSKLPRRLLIHLLSFVEIMRASKDELFSITKKK